MESKLINFLKKIFHLETDGERMRRDGNKIRQEDRSYVFSKIGDNNAKIYLLHSGPIDKSVYDYYEKIHILLNIAPGDDIAFLGVESLNKSKYVFR